MKKNKLTEKQPQEGSEHATKAKEKRNGDIKAKTCTDGRKQRKTISEDEAASPTVMLESVLLTAMQDAKEGRQVATMDQMHHLFSHAWRTQMKT